MAKFTEKYIGEVMGLNVLGKQLLILGIVVILIIAFLSINISNDNKHKEAKFKAQLEQSGDTLVVKKVIYPGGFRIVVLFEDDIIGVTCPDENEHLFKNSKRIIPGNKLNIIFTDSVNFIVKKHL